MLCKYTARGTRPNSQKEQCCRDSPYRIQHTVAHLFHRQKRNGQYVIDWKKSDQSKQWIYFCDRQQNGEKKHCHRRNQSYNLIFTDCRQQQCHSSNAKGTGKRQQDLILEQRTAGDVKRDECFHIVAGGKQDTAIQPIRSVKGKGEKQVNGCNQRSRENSGENTSNHLCSSTFGFAVFACQYDIVNALIFTGEDRRNHHNDRQCERDESSDHVSAGRKPTVDITDFDFFITEHIRNT